MTEAKRAKARRFKGRGFTSFLVTVSFLAMSVSGVVLYVTPKGRVANWTDWRMAGLTKEGWAAVHTTTSLLFVIAAGFHLWLNWRVFVSYLRATAARGLNLKRELALALVIAAALVVGTVLDVPPLKTIMDWNAGIKAYWERTSEPAPYAHAEESTLEAFARNVDVPLETVLARLSAQGYRVTDTSVTVGDLAAQHGVAPSFLFRVMQAKGTPARGGGSGEHARGLGRKTLKQVCDEHRIPVDEAIARLRDKGVDAHANDRLRALAEQLGSTPGGVVDLIKS